MVGARREERYLGRLEPKTLCAIEKRESDDQASKQAKEGEKIMSILQSATGT